MSTYNLRRLNRYGLAGAVALALAACGGGGGSGSGGISNTQYSIGGSVSGLAGSGLTLTLNGGAAQAVSANGSFTLTPQVASGGSYTVAVGTQPSSPTQTCAVANGTGTASATVTNVTVTCTTNSYTVGGSTTGLTGTVVLRNTVAGTNTDVPVTGSAFVFPAQASGTAYNVQVLTQPVGQTCSATSNTGTVTTANVSNVTVTCAVAAFPVSGTVTGLSGTGLVLAVNGGNAQTIATSGPFAFSPIATGATYTVTVQTQPSSPAQTCVVTNGTGTIAGPVTNVAVSCSTSNFTVGGTVTNVIGSGLVLQNNAGGNLSVAAGATSYVFPAQASGSAYAVTVLTQPGTPAQTCTLSNGSGTVQSANVTNANLSCTNSDTLAPTATLSTRAPASGVVGANLTGAVSVDFSEALKPSTVTTGSFQLAGPGGAVTGVVSLANSNQRAVFTPSAPLAFDTTYTATITTVVSDPSNNALAANVTWKFNTGHKIAAGGFHTCARLAGADNGKVKCWGSANFGQLGEGNTNSRGTGAGDVAAGSPIVDLGTGRTAVDIVAGESHTCALLDNGALKCWGRNAEGELGLADNSDRGDGPNEMGDNLPAVTTNFTGRKVYQVVTGLQHTCARLEDAAVYCWGLNGNGIIGQETNAGTFTEYNHPQPVSLGTGLKATAVATFGFHTCAILDNSSSVYAGVKCWGENSYGQLGLGDAFPYGDAPGEMGDNLPFVDFGAGRTVKQIAPTSGHTCVLLDNDELKCYGNNWFGQIGTDSHHTDCTTALGCVGDDPSEIPALLPVVPLTLAPGVKVVQIAGGDRQTCVVTSIGTTLCWGWNDFGQLGRGNTFTYGDDPGDMAQVLPTILSTSATVVKVYAGGFHECALLSDASVKCWGYNAGQIVSGSPLAGQGGQLGIGESASNNRGDTAGEMGDNLPAVDLTP